MFGNSKSSHCDICIENLQTSNLCLPKAAAPFLWQGNLSIYRYIYKLRDFLGWVFRSTSKKTTTIQLLSTTTGNLSRSVRTSPNKKKKINNKNLHFQFVTSLQFCFFERCLKKNKFFCCCPHAVVFNQQNPWGSIHSSGAWIMQLPLSMSLARISKLRSSVLFSPEVKASTQRPVLPVEIPRDREGSEKKTMQQRKNGHLDYRKFCLGGFCWFMASNSSFQFEDME